MTNRTYSVYDDDPRDSSGTIWHDRQDEPAEGETLDEAIAFVQGELAEIAAGLTEGEEGYDVGQSIYAMITDVDGMTLVISHEITIEDLR